MHVWNETRYLFITANPGSGGHQLGRWITSLSNVYWYNTKTNFLESSLDNLPDFIKGPRNVSKYHFQREMDNGRYVPGVSSRIYRHWNTFDEWKEMFDKRMSRIHNVYENYLPWVIHTSPQILNNLFPNSKIINLMDINIERYMNTTAKFPYYYEFKGQTPTTYVKEYTRELNQLHSEYPNMTFEQYWLYTNGYTEWTAAIIKEYYNHTFEMLSDRVDIEDDNILNVSWGNYKEEIKEFLNV